MRSIRSRPVVVTGGAGFIGAGLADRLLRTGKHVLVIDDLSAAHSTSNLDWLRARHGDRVQVRVGDVCEPAILEEALARTAGVYHLAARTGADASPDEVSLLTRGTIQVLEALRRAQPSVPFLFVSGTEVYGTLEDVELTELTTRWEPAAAQVRAHGLAEDRPLSPGGPLAAASAAAERAVLEHGRLHGLAAVVLRAGCVYGPRQRGADQGWMSRFLLQALDGEPIQVFGDGKQVRDPIFIDDLVDALLLAHREVDRLAGRIFNIGGGVSNALSPLELIDLVTLVQGTRPRVAFEPARPSDPRYLVSDLRAFRAATGWVPRLGAREGVQRLHHWLLAERAGARASSSPGGLALGGHRAHRAKAFVS